MKMMKQVMRFALLLSSALLMLTACEKEDTPQGKAPANIGPITLNRTRIGAGQPVVATSPLPTGGENIASVEYQWQSTSDGLAMDGQQDDSQSTFSFTAPKTPGDYTVVFTARYVFTYTDQDGNAGKVVTATKNYTVEACDALTSFWDDDLETTLLNRPSLTKYTDDIYVGQFPDQFSQSQLNPPLISTLYTFTSNKLTRIAENETYSTTTATGYVNKYMYIRAQIIRLLGVQPSVEAVQWTDGQPAEAFNPDGDSEYMTRIGEGIMNHTASITSVFSGEKSDMRLEVYTGESGNINYMRTYQKAGTMYR